MTVITRINNFIVSFKSELITETEIIFSAEYAIESQAGKINLLYAGREIFLT